MFLRSPVEIIADKTSGRLSKVRMEINQLEVSELVPLIAAVIQYALYLMDHQL